MAAAVLLHQMLDGGGGVLLGGVRLQLERAPDDVHGVLMLVLRERLLEAHLPDVAPGARYVRPDLYLHPVTLTTRNSPEGSEGYPEEGSRENRRLATFAHEVHAV